MRDPEKRLDEALSGRVEPGDDLGPLVDTARRLEGALTPAERPDPRTRALFVEAAAAGAGRPRFAAAFAGAAVLLLAVAFVGRNAMPGQALYPVREVLKEVGLAHASLEEVDDLIDDARLDVARAEHAEAAEAGRQRAIDPAVRALGTLGAARALLDDIAAAERTSRRARIEELERRATAVIVSIGERLHERSGDDGSEDAGEGDGDDSSGPGSDDDPGDDSSGPGSGDDDGSDSDDSDDSESGSDDSDDPESDSDDSDNSGPGSDDSDDRDGSGSGSDDDLEVNGSDDDSSGPGGDDVSDERETD